MLTRPLAVIGIASILCGRAATAQLPPRVFLLPPDRPHVDGLPEPLVALTIKDPWLMAIGSDSPKFALYSNGLVIMERPHATWQNRYEADSLTSSALDSLVKALDISPAFFELNDYYDAVNNCDPDGRCRRVTDLPTYVLYVRQGARSKTVTVYGLGFDSSSPGPAPVTTILDRIGTYKAQDPQPWVPPFVELMLWPFEYARDKTVLWPHTWPSLDDSLTLRRGPEQVSIFLPRSRFPEVVAFLRALRETQAVALNEHKWTVSLRYPFAGEAHWVPALLGRE